jgi:hypothetical protein
MNEKVILVYMDILGPSALAFLAFVVPSAMAPPPNGFPCFFLSITDVIAREKLLFSLDYIRDCARKKSFVINFFPFVIFIKYPYNPKLLFHSFFNHFQSFTAIFNRLCRLWYPLCRL